MLTMKRGDVDALTPLIARWQQPVINFIHRMLPDVEEAEDLAQNVFIQLWRTADRYEPAAKFTTFLFTIARNLCLNEIRRRKRHPADRLDAPVAGDDGEELGRQYGDHTQMPADSELERKELFSKVDEAVADLPEKQRLALALCRDGELSYDEIAGVLELSIPATKSLIFRAREVLRTRLKSYLVDGAWAPSGGAQSSTSPSTAAMAAANAAANVPSGGAGNFSGSMVMNPVRTL